MGAGEPVRAAEVYTPRLLEEDALVSSASVFSDPRWDFSAEIGDASLAVTETRIEWKFQITAELNSFDLVYATILLSLKQLAYAMLFQPEVHKCLTVVRTIARLKQFVIFLGERPLPVYRFQDVLESDMETYIARLRERPGRNGRPLDASTLSRYLQILNKLYDYKDFLGDYLRFRPTGQETPTEIAGSTRKVRVSTQAIPDDELKSLINTALDCIQNQASRTLDCLEAYNRFSKGVDFSKFKSSDVKSVYVEKHFFSEREDFRSGPELNSSLIRLRTACFIVVAFCTGMRISEILATRRGCVRQQPDPNHGTFYWIDSLLFKTQKKNSGSPRSWMCGRLAANAVSVLERVGELLGAGAKNHHLFLAFQHFGIVARGKSRTTIKCISGRKMRNDVKDFCVYHRLDDSIHPHQLRRSFARNIIRYSTTPILALKDHLKHWSLYMTDWYIGMDANLIEDLEAERLLLSVESMEKICTQTVGGNGGRRWTYELNRRIAEGRLPRTFRGKAGAEFRRKMIDSLHDSGSVVFPCGEFTSCVFQMDRALCTEGERPITNRCNPFDCANSYILPEHAPYYREKLTTLTLLFEKLNEAEKGGPVGSFYLLEMVKVRRVLKTFDE